MKIFNKLQEQSEEQKQLFALDSPVLKRALGALTLTVYISAISVAAGFYFQFHNTFSSGNFIIRTLSYIALAAFVFAWAKYIDGTTTAATEWIVNSLQNQVFWKGIGERIRTAVLIIAWGIAVYFLASLSYDLSQVSAEKAGKAWSGEAKTTDAVDLNSANEDKKLAALALFDSTYNQTARDYNSQIVAAEAPFLGKIKEYEGYKKSAKIERTGADLQTYLNRQNRNIAAQEKAKTKATVALREEKRLALKEIRADQKKERERLNSINDANLSGVMASNEKIEEEHDKFEDTFSSILSFIAGYAIFIALLLAAAVGLMKGRAGWQPEPVFDNYDHNGHPLVEILSTPFVILQRLLLNFSRWIKDLLPDMREPEKEFSFESYEGNIIPMYESNKARANLETKSPKKQKKIAAAANRTNSFFFRQESGEVSTGPAQTANHEPQMVAPNHQPSTTNSVGFSWTIKDPLTQATKTVGAEELKVVNPNLDGWQLKQKLKKYKKAVGEHSQKAIKQEKATGEVTDRTAKAIRNNQIWVLSIEKRLKELEGEK